MRGIWFFDDWMLERRDCLERVWGKPTFVKEIFAEFYPDGWDGYGGYPTAFYDERLGRYALYLIAFPGRECRDRTPGISAGEFQFRLLSDDPCNWPNPVYSPTSGPAWRSFDDVVVGPGRRAVLGARGTFAGRDAAGGAGVRFGCAGCAASSDLGRVLG